MLDRKTILQLSRQTMRELGRQMYEYRCAKKMSLSEVGNYGHVSPRIIELWELGKGYPDLYWLSRIAAVYGCKVVINFEKNQSKN